MTKKQVTVTVTAQEKKLVKLLSDGKSVIEAATAMGVNPRTFERTVYDLRKSCKCVNLPHLVAFFLRQGLIK